MNNPNNDKITLHCLGCGRPNFTGKKNKDDGRIVCSPLTRHILKNRKGSFHGSTTPCYTVYMNLKLVTGSDTKKFNFRTSKQHSIPNQKKQQETTKDNTVDDKLDDIFTELNNLTPETRQSLGLLELSNVMQFQDKFSQADHSPYTGPQLKSVEEFSNQLCQAKLSSHFSPSALLNYANREFSNATTVDQHIHNEPEEEEEETIKDPNLHLLESIPESDSESQSSQGSGYNSLVENLVDYESTPQDIPCDILIQRFIKETKIQNSSNRYNPFLKTNVSLLQLIRRHKLPLGAVKDFQEWAAEAVLSKPDIFRTKADSREQMLQKFRKELGMDSANEFKEHIINWLPDNRPTKLYIRSFVDCLYELLSNVEIIGPGGENISLPHPTSPYISRPPSTTSNDISELHHGSWWPDTMERLCAPGKKEILVPIILYIDGVHTDTNDRLSVTPLNLTLGIINTNTRRLPNAHTAMYYHPDNETESAHHELPTKAFHKLQNLHRGLQCALADLKKFMDGKLSLSWNLPYAGQIFPVNMIFSIAFIIGDTEMHDKLCGRYSSRTRGIQSHCRHCDCSMEDLVTPDKVQEARFYNQYRLDPDRKQRDDDYWKKVSHHPIHNVFHTLCFGANKYGIHLATPGELLHMHQKGAQVRVVEALEYMIRKGKKLSNNEVQATLKTKKINATLDKMNLLGHHFGSLLQRQSERDKPRTRFKNSLFAGTKKSGHEHAGVILNLLLAMLSDRGRQIMLVERTVDGRYLEDFVFIFEMVLMIEEWLKLKKLPSSHRDENRVGDALDHYVEMLAGICARAGMGQNLIKNHLVLHFATYIAHFGIPTGWDSGFSENHHKTQVKVPAKNTQRRQATFIQQVSQRYYESIVIRRAETHFQMTSSYLQKPRSDVWSRKDKDIQCSGSRFSIGLDGKGNPGLRWTKKKNSGRAGFPQGIYNFVCQELLPLIRHAPTAEHCVRGCTEVYVHISDDLHETIVFRAHPNYKSRSRQTNDVWFDWAYFDIPGRDGSNRTVGHIVMFLELGDLTGEDTKFQGVDLIKNEVCAVVRLFKKTPKQKWRDSYHKGSGIPYTRLVKWGELSESLFLIPCRYIVYPATVVPNVPALLEIENNQETDNQSRSRRKEKSSVDTVDGVNGYLVVSNRKQWAQAFVREVERG